MTSTGRGREKQNETERGRGDRKVEGSREEGRRRGRREGEELLNRLYSKLSPIQML